MKLLLLTNEFPNSDQPTRGMFNYQMVRALERQGDSVEVVSPVSWVVRWRNWWMERRSNGDRSTLLEGRRAHFPTYYYTPGMLRTWYGCFMWYSIRRTLLSAVRAAPPDAVVGYWAHPDGEAALRLARRMGVPCVVVVGGSDVLLLCKNRARCRKVARVLQGADAVIVVSEDLKSKVEELGVAPDKVHVGWRGIDTEKFSPGDRAEARRRLALPPNRRLLLWVGGMLPVKGLGVLIRACGVLKDTHVDFQLLLVGRGPVERALRSQCDALGLNEHVTFVGPVLHADLPDWYRAADLFVLPSRSEGLPNVLMESMASGIPFVASRVGGIPEIASPTCDQLVPAGDHAALARAIGEQLVARPCRSGTELQQLNWASAARQVAQLLEPLVRCANVTTSLPYGLAYSKLNLRLPPWSWRQIARRLMVAGVPKRFFIASGPSRQRLVWLTFDDGPDPEHTPHLLDVLKAHNVRATFFVIGMKAEQHPDLVRRMANEGHCIGNHTFCHKRLDELSYRDLHEEVRRTSRVLQGLLGETLPIFRPPHGKMKISTLWQMLRAGQQVVLWNTDPKDYLVSSPAMVSDWFRAHVLNAGDIVLLHDNRPFAADVLPEVIRATRERGLEFATFEHPAICRHSCKIAIQ
jgi:teichuronic acid biosynthesis glycosyltransferase TuaC